MNMPFSSLIKNYKINDPNYHKYIWESFYDKVNSITNLKNHRNYIERFRYGYGDRPFHYMWKLLVDEMPKSFNFLEIGVFKGQITSLIQLLSSETGRKVKIYGVTPLNSAGDKYGKHPKINYLKALRKIYKDFNLDFSNTAIIKGFSHHKRIVQKVAAHKPYDLVFIDGCHEYKIVVSDIENYAPFVKKNGYLIIDDSAYFLNFPNLVRKGRGNFISRMLPFKYVEMFKGFYDVSKAIKDTLDADRRFKHVFSCGHDRVWKRIS